MIQKVKERWAAPNGYGDVLTVGLPLVISLGSTTVMEFTDRVFLSHYSMDAIAAALPANIVNLTLMLTFIGIAGYANVFIAQYYGSKSSRRVGAALWQAIYMSLIGGVILASMAFVAEPIFAFGGHAPSVQAQEVIYFRILTIGSSAALMASSLGCFFSGRGYTRPNMVVNIIATVINIPLDYMMIFGVGPFPEMGIAGAGYATASSWTMQMVMYAYLIFNKRNEECYGVISNRAFDKELFSRMLRFGFPSGVNYFAEIFAVAFFSFVIGRLGKVELAASNMAFSINTVAFLPMIGLNIAVSTLVGQNMGAGNPQGARVATANTLHIAMTWMVLLAGCFFLFPEWLLNIFKPGSMSVTEFAPVRELGVLVLRFVAFYCLFDAVTIIYFGAVKGAGDTNFVMWAMLACAIGALILPLYIAQSVFQAGLTTLWTIFAFYIALLAAIAFWRFSGDKWMKITLVETAAHTVNAEDEG